MKIESRIIKSAKVVWQNFKFIQTDKFKVLGIQEKERLKNSILNNQFVESFKVWENDGTIYCLDGFHRCLVLKELESEGHEIPKTFKADFIDCKNELEAAKLVLIYSSRYAKIDVAGLQEFIATNSIEIGEISSMIDIPDIDINSINVDIDIDITDNIDMDSEEDGDDLNIPDKTFIKPGDIFILGRHKVICGDSTSPETYKILMDGKEAAICLTSPPYNCGAIEREDQNRTGQKYLNNTDQMTHEQFMDLLCKSLNLSMNHSDTSFYNIQMLANNKIAVIDFMNMFKNDYKDTIYWYKTNPAPSLQKKIINSCIELIPGFSKKNNSRAFPTASFNQGTYYNVIQGTKNMENKYKKIHKAAFPLYLPLNIINNFTKENDIVLDNFGGTGSTLIACEKLNRICYTIDIEPIYCHVIIQRYIDETGNKVYRSDGKEFSELF